MTESNNTNMDAATKEYLCKRIADLKYKVECFESSMRAQQGLIDQYQKAYDDNKVKRDEFLGILKQLNELVGIEKEEQA